MAEKTHVRHAGAWRECTAVHARHSGAWRSLTQVNTRHGGAWRQHLTFTPTVSFVSTNVSFSNDIGNTYAGIQYNSNGTEYQNSSPTSTSYTQSRGAWLDSGSAGGAWAQYTINSGSLNSSNPGSGRLQLSTTRSYRVVDTNPAAGGNSCDYDMRIYDAASGGSVIQGPFNLVLTATLFNACPTCCFTPDTLITMSDGKQIPISMVRVGDEIVVYDPLTGSFNVEKVEEIITRIKRRMYKITFEDGTVLHCSDDHPLDVGGEPASVKPQGLYKWQWDPKTLRVGDWVTCIKASWWEGHDVERIISIEYAEYPEEVYTLGNTLFFANNKLVY